MENQFFLNGGVPHHPIQFETTTPQSHFSSMQTWHHHHHHQLSSSSSSPMEIQQPAHESFYNNPTTTTTATDHHNLYFDSALSSIVSSPSASNSNNIPQNENNFVIRELTGKLGTIGSSGEISPHNSLQPLVYNSIPSLGNNNNHLVNENSNIKPIALNSSVAEFSADPGFAERAAKFSCFGSRSFNGRTSQIAANNAVAVAAAAELTQRSTTVTAPFMENNGRLSRVSSSPSLKTLGSQMVAMENKNNSPLQERIEASNSQDESTISEQAPNGETGLKPSPDMNSRKRKASSRGKPKEATTPSNPTKGVEGSEDSNAKRMKPNNDGGEGNENNNNGSVKVEEDSKGEEKQNNKSNNSKPPEPPKDYIHVRARRGQATDSHSLAERVRREKISERMKLLQDLVPGCNKVTGKALMLDEIINYVQSLQRQVEFLSMKLASVNTRMNLSIESLIPKDIFQSNHSLAHPINFPLDSSATPFYGHQTQQNPVIHNDIIPNGTVSHNSVDPLLDTSLCQNLGMQLPPLNGFNEVGSQYPLTFCEDDLHTIVQMGFGQTTNMKTPIQSPSFNGSNQVSQMKVEL